jgi:hypothetical protein
MIVQALIKKIQIVAIIVAAVIVAVVVYTSISKWKISEEELTPLVSEKIVFTPPLELTDAIEGVPYEYSFCRPKSARSGATCGGLAGETENPYGGKPPYSFSHQFGVGFIPTGLALELNGLLRGTPTLPGNYTFGVCVTDLQEEVCKTTSLTVKPKSKQIEKQPEEKVSPSVKIESATVIKKEILGYHYKTGLPTCECTFKLSGTATLRVDIDELDIVVYVGGKRGKLDATHPPTPDMAMSPGFTHRLTCPNWEDYDEPYCDRFSYDKPAPATGEWTAKITDIFAENLGYTETYFAVVQERESARAWDSVTLTCCP